MEHVNQPALITTYKDPLTLCDKLCLVIDLPSGVTDFQLKLPGIGPAASILLVSYLWPELVYKVTGLFDKEIKAGIMTEIQPAITALKLELEKTRSNIQDIPRGSIQITLPVPVQTNSDAMVFKAGMNAKGVTVLVVHLQAFHTDYTAKKHEYAVNFETFLLVFFLTVFFPKVYKLDALRLTLRN